MKSHHVILALLAVCVIVGIQMQTTEPSIQPVPVITPQDSNALAEISPFATAAVWTTTTGSQVVGTVSADFDIDSNDEVAVILQNGTLVLFDDNSSLLWRLNLGSTPRAIAAIDGTAVGPLEILVGTNDGVVVVAADKSLLMNMSLPEPVYAVAGANVDGDVYDEVVVGCDDFYVYAYEIDTTPVWDYLSNGRVRLLKAEDVDADGRDEVLAASDARRLTLLQDTGAVIFEKTSGTGITAIGFGDLTIAADLDVVMGNSNGTLSVWRTTGTLEYSRQVKDSIIALDIGQLIAAGNEEVALGTSAGALRVYDSSGTLLWNKTLASQVNRIALPNVAALATQQVLVARNNILTLYNSTGWRVTETSIQGLTRYMTFGDLDSFGGEEYIIGTNTGILSAYGRDFDRDRLADARERLIEGSDYDVADTDGEGLDDGEEVLDYDTSPLLPDSDFDKLSDFAEVITHGTDPNDPTTDGDLLTDWQEIYLGTDPLAADTDLDQLDDYEENNITLTDPRDSDTNNNGINDAQDDNDGDGLTNLQEVRLTKTDPNDVDSDSDGTSDYYDDQELDGLANWREIQLGTGVYDPDSDDDLINDGPEVLVYKTNPLSEDTDQDSLTDFEEIMIVGSDPLSEDGDDDGLSDFDEYTIYGPDVNNPYSDLDGLKDDIILVKLLEAVPVIHDDGVPQVAPIIEGLPRQGRRIDLIIGEAPHVHHPSGDVVEVPGLLRVPVLLGTGTGLGDLKD